MMKLLIVSMILGHTLVAQTLDSSSRIPAMDTTDIIHYHPMPYADYQWAIYIPPEFSLSGGVQPGIQLGFGSFNSFAYGMSGWGLSSGVSYNIHREDMVIGGNIFGAAIAFFGGPNARLGINYHVNSGNPFVGVKAEFGLAITALFFNYSYERNISERNLPRHIHSFTLTNYLPAIRWGRKNKNDLTPIPYWSD